MTQPAFDAETLEFYRREAHFYANRRQSASHNLPAFLARLPPGGAILELGCGGGHDAEAMIAAGFDVTPTDGSAEIAAQAQARLGRPVRVLPFDALDMVDRFDGVWANACLLHVPVEALAGVLARVRRALKDGGVFYASFKGGDGPARDALGRYNNLVSRSFLEGAMAEAGPWADVDIAETPAGSYDGAVYTWLICTAVKAPRALPGGHDRGSNRADLLVRGVYALCLLAATSTHVAALVQHGLFWNYGGVSWLTAVFWTSLTLADPIAAACLFLSPRLGLILTSGIIGLDVLHNGLMVFSTWPPPPHVPLWSYVQLGLQLAFLLFVMATVRIPWSRLRSTGVPNRAGP